jgi:two-component system cell cycle response regulator
MNKLANVLVVETRREQATSVMGMLEQAGYAVTVAGTIAEAEDFARTEHPDLVLVGALADAVSPIAAAGALKRAAADIPTLLLVDQVTPSLCEEALALGLDDVVLSDSSDVEILARLRPLVRLTVMHGELRRRAEAADHFGVAARDRVTGPDGARAAVLVIGDDRAEVDGILGDVCEIADCETLYDAEQELTRRNFDAAILSFRTAPDSLVGFCGQLRNNPRLFNLPIVVRADAPADEGDWGDTLYRHGATRVLPHTVDPSVFRSAVLGLVRRQQLRWAIRSALNDSLADATRDSETGAYSRSFLDEYLPARLRQALASDRHLTVVFFSAPTIQNVLREFGEEAASHLTRQVGQWITGLLRAEDLVVRYATYEFCVVLPDTPLSEAEIVMHRIAGVLAYTDFAVHEVYQPVKVWVQVGATDSQPGDDVLTLLARARRNLD